MPSADWPNFRSSTDLLSASHRGLTRHLIPGWLVEPKTLNEKIESSAYGETPQELFHQLLAFLQPRAGETFLDLGSGGGNICAMALRRGLKAVGIERNPVLHKLAVEFISGLKVDGWELHQCDFLEMEWPAAEVAYSTTTRFPASLLRELARRVEASSTLRAVLCLGQALPLSDSWEIRQVASAHISWNPGESPLQELAFLHLRTCLIVQSECI